MQCREGYDRQEFNVMDRIIGKRIQGLDFTQGTVLIDPRGLLIAEKDEEQYVRFPGETNQFSHGPQ